MKDLQGMFINFVAFDALSRFSDGAVFVEKKILSQLDAVPAPAITFCAFTNYRKVQELKCYKIVDHKYS